MSISNVTIANRALTLLSADRIQALNETSEQARKINAIFDDTRDALLEEHNWNFALKERNLALLADQPILAEYGSVFQLPSDCIRVISLEGDYAFSIKGNKLYTNATSAKIEYVSRETDPTRFSKGFVKALASRLAADLAFGITQNATLASNIDAVAIRDLREAKWSDAQAGRGIRVIHGSMINGR